MITRLKKVGKGIKFVMSQQTSSKPSGQPSGQTKLFGSVIELQPGKNASQVIGEINSAGENSRGFQGASHLTNPQTNQDMALTLWDNEQAYKQAAQSGVYGDKIRSVGTGQTFQGQVSMGSQPGNPSRS